ncbi:zinc finger, CCHC-type containing protein [Tanacetum coccineum]
MTAAMKHMVASFSKLDKFKGLIFRRWQKKMHFILSTMSVVYVLNTPIPDDGDDTTVKKIKRMNKWENDDYVCHSIILNCMFDSLFDIYQNVESEKELWDSLEAKYMAEDASSKMFLVSNFINYKMTNTRPVIEQYNKLLGILGRLTQHKMNMDEVIQVFCIIDKLPPSWKDFKHTLKHKKEELTLVELGSHLRIEESLGVQDSDKPKSNNVAGPSVINMVEHNNSIRKPAHLKKDCKGGKFGNKANGSGTNVLVNGSSNLLKGQNMFNKSLQVYYVTYLSESYFVQDDDVAYWVDSGATVHVRIKMPDENQILLKVPRQHNMYSFDMKTPSVTKDYACLIAKATSDESKLWHRRFSWVFFLATKDETSGILQNFIRQIENQLNHKVKIIRSDNGTEFKNRDMLEFYGNKGIKQEYSNARTPQQNGVAERMNKTLIKAARTMLADSLLPTTF